jgi:hypothetical protein
LRQCNLDGFQFAVALLGGGVGRIGADEGMDVGAQGAEGPKRRIQRRGGALSMATVASSTSGENAKAGFHG